jgi:hypothetical protein
MNVDELRKIGTESYDKWFERWYEKENLEEKLKQSAMKGYSSYSYNPKSKHRTEYENRRMSDKRFVEKLEGKLDGFRVYRQEPKKYELNLLGKNLGTRWTDPEVIISWKEE